MTLREALERHGVDVDVMLDAELGSTAKPGDSASVSVWAQMTEGDIMEITVTAWAWTGA